MPGQKRRVKIDDSLTRNVEHRFRDIELVPADDDHVGVDALDGLYELGVFGSLRAVEGLPQLDRHIMDVLVGARWGGCRDDVLQGRLYVGHDVRVVSEEVVKVLVGELPCPGSDINNAGLAHEWTP